MGNDIADALALLPGTSASCWILPNAPPADNPDYVALGSGSLASFPKSDVKHTRVAGRGRRGGAVAHVTSLPDSEN